MNIRILTIASIFMAIAVSPFVSKAQTLAPVDAEFFGEWIFDYAQVQERPENSHQGYVTRSVSQDDFWQKSYLLNVPTRVTFMGDFVAHISHPSWSKLVVAIMNNGLLEFRSFQENPENYGRIPALSEIHLYPTITPAFLLTQSGSLMTLQCNYTDTQQTKPVEGILTIHYKRF